MVIILLSKCRRVVNQCELPRFSNKSEGISESLRKNYNKNLKDVNISIIYQV